MTDTVDITPFPIAGRTAAIRRTPSTSSSPRCRGTGSPHPMQPGWGNLFRVAQAWSELMSRLGYDRYGAQGTDAGSGVAGMLAMMAADRVVGVHLTGTVAAMPLGPALEVDGCPRSTGRGP